MPKGKTTPSKYGRKCPECKSSNFLEDPTRGELVCSKCGLVMEEEMIDTGQEWRAFDTEQMSRRARAGAPLTFTKHDKGLTTEIGKGVGELCRTGKTEAEGIQKVGVKNMAFN